MVILIFFELVWVFWISCVILEIVEDVEFDVVFIFKYLFWLIVLLNILDFIVFLMGIDLLEIVFLFIVVCFVMILLFKGINFFGLMVIVVLIVIDFINIYLLVFVSIVICGVFSMSLEIVWWILYVKFL